MKKVKRAYVSNHWTFKPHTREITFTHSNQVNQLPNMVSNLLHILCQNQGKFVDRNELFDLLWEGNYAVGDRGLRQVVFQLRKALATADNNNPVINIPRKGYQLTTEVEEQLLVHPLRNKQWHIYAGASLLLAFLVLLFSPSEPNDTISIEAVPVTTDSGLEAAFAVAPDQQTLLYNKEVDGVFKVFKKQLSSTNTTSELLVSGSDDVGGMVWNHSGDKVAYVQYTGQQYSSDIYILDLQRQSSQLIARHVTFDIGQSPHGIAWSPVADQLVYTAPSSHDKLALYVYDSVMAISEQLTMPEYIDAFPQWSPDGKFITFHALDMDYQSELHLIDVASRKTTGLTANQVNLFGHTWVDHQHVLFSAQSEEALIGKLLNIHSRQITPIKTAGNFQFPQRSGSDIYYLRTKQELQLQTHQLERQTLQFDELIESIGNDVMPVVHAGSEKLIFISDRSGHQELWYQSQAHAKPEQITFKAGVVTDPSFSESGRLILYHWFNADTQAFQLGVYDLEQRQEVPIDLIASRKGLFAGGDNYIAFLQVTALNRQLWVYDIANNTKRMINTELINILGSYPEKHEVYFDQQGAYYSHNLLTEETRRLADLSALRNPFLIQGGGVYYPTFHSGRLDVMKHDFSTGEQQLVFAVSPALADKLHGLTIGDNEQKVVLSLYSKNEGDIYKFPITQLID